MNPLLSSATGGYRQRAPLTSLRGHFARTWLNTMPASGARIAVVPDGWIDLLWVAGELKIAGPDRVVKCEALRPGATVIGLRFHPGAASRWLRVPASDIVGARVPLEVFWGREARWIAEWAGRGPDAAAIARRLEQALSRRAEGIRAPDPAAGAIRHVLEGAPDGPADVGQFLRSHLGLTERTLRRRCQEAFGYGPKTLQRILRFQRFLRLARQPGTRMAGLASEAGYCDQAHLTREARRLAAMTPAGIQAQLGRP